MEPVAGRWRRRPIGPNYQREHFLDGLIPVESSPSSQTLPARRTSLRCRIGAHAADKLLLLQRSTIPRVDAKRGCRRWGSNSTFLDCLVGGSMAFPED